MPISGLACTCLSVCTHARVLMPACVALNSELGGGLVPVSAGARVSSAQSQTQNLNAKLR